MPYGRNGICLLWHRAESNCNYSLLINSSVGEWVREPIDGGKRCSAGGSRDSGLQGTASSHRARSPHPASTGHPSVTAGRGFPHPSTATSSKGGAKNHAEAAPQVPQPTPTPSPGAEQTHFPALTSTSRRVIKKIFTIDLPAPSQQSTSRVPDTSHHTELEEEQQLESHHKPPAPSPRGFML